MLFKLCTVGRRCRNLGITSLLLLRSVGTTFLSCSNMSAKHESASLELDGNVAVVTINIPDSKENVLTKQLRHEIAEIFDKINSDPRIHSAVIISGKPNSFIAGADISELLKVKSSEEAVKLSADGQEKLMRIEKSEKPYVAAISGSCMGGGLEVALACHYRIAMNSKTTKLSLPEIQLGLLPGAGGTQRLPKLISFKNALDMMLTGKVIRPSKAKKIGLVDHIIQPIGVGQASKEANNMNYLRKVAVDVANGLSVGTLKPNRERPWLERVTNYLFFLTPFRQLTFSLYERQVMKLTNGNYPAPLNILNIVKNVAEKYKDEERQFFHDESVAFGTLAKTFQSAALIGLFQGSTDCKKNKFGNARKPEKLSVIGAGLMGAGIANVSIDKGIKTVMLDVNDDGLSRGLNQVHSHLNASVRKKKMSSIQQSLALSNLKFSTNYDDVAGSDVVIEAVFEDLSLKHKVIQQIESVVSSDCVIATNTSALPILEIASGSSKPERIIGMHYFSPVERMQLLEIITTDKTSRETLSAAANLGLLQKKLVVVVKDGPGFFVVRCLSPMLNEILRLMQEGVNPSVVDKLTKSYGFPLGGATLVDEVGLDVADHISRFLSEALKPRLSGGSIEMLSEIVRSGYNGRKSGKGFFIYGDNQLSKAWKVLIGKPENKDVLKIIRKYRTAPQLEVSSDEDRQLRVISRYVNEAALCLEEGIISSPSDGDVASVFGIGFPPFFGGPFRFVDTFGVQRFVDNLRRFGDAYSPEQFKPADILVEYAKGDKKFYSK